jgi:hypothetical protein
MNGDIGRISWPQLWLPAASGIFLALATLSLFAALALGPISLVAPIVGTYPALSMIFALAQGTRPSVMQWFAIAAVIAGAAIVSRGGSTYENSGHIPTGKLKTISCTRPLCMRGADQRTGQFPMLTRLPEERTHDAGVPLLMTQFGHVTV